MRDRTYCDRIQPSEGVQRIDETRNKANDIIIPPGFIHPGPKDEFTVIMARRFGSDCDHENEPRQLEIDHYIESIQTSIQGETNSQENLLISGRNRFPNIITADVRMLNP